jgi:hemerythrin-like domain-containing protein
VCSYCGCQAITVIGRFMAEHDDVVNGLTALRSACAAEDAPATVAAVQVMAGLLHPHTHAEEVGLFAVMGQDEEFHDHIDVLCGEHRGLDGLLDELAAGAFDRFGAFERALRAHIDKEDNGLFPAAAIALSGPDWDRVDALTPPPR